MKITVFTPTFNRVDLLRRLYNSLCAQTCKEFEWLVIDDGSTDDTGVFLADIRKQSDFQIQYFWTENGGKHHAYNEALKYASGEWFICLDSDDQLVATAVQTIVDELNDHNAYDGLVAYKEDKQGTCICDALPKGVEAIHIPELETVYNCKGDYVFVYSTELARKFPFPCFKGEKFVPEAVMLDVLGQQCLLKVLPQALMICEYQADGYTQSINTIIARNPKGYSVYFMQRIDVYPSLKQKMIAAGKYWSFRWMGGKPPVRYTGKHRLLTGLCLLLGLIFRVYYKFVRGF